MNDSGYWIGENIFSKLECDDLLQSLSNSTVKRGRAGARNLMRNPAISMLASENRLLRIAEMMLGRSAVPYKATLFDKSGKANWLVAWHQDTALPLMNRVEKAGWEHWSEKAGILYAHAPAWALSRILAIRIHLDASTRTNGPLKIIPGSHVKGVMTDEEVKTIVNAETHVECLVGQGGVLAMSPLLIHSSSKAQTEESRRVLHIEYTDSLELDRDIRLAIA